MMVVKCKECQLEPKGELEWDVKNYILICPKCNKKSQGGSAKMVEFRWKHKNKERVANNEKTNKRSNL